MTNLKKIIDKAVSGGWKMPESYKDDNWMVLVEHLPSIITDDIFSHDFLTAFFGEEMFCTICNVKNYNCKCASKYMKKSWKYHAQQLVLSEDRIKYLMDYMEG